MHSSAKKVTDITASRWHVLVVVEINNMYTSTNLACLVIHELNTSNCTGDISPHKEPPQEFRIHFAVSITFCYTSLSEFWR